MSSYDDEDEREIEASRAPLLDHLIELRKRLVICIVAFGLGFGLCFAFAEPIYIFLLKPFETAARLMAAQGEGHGHSPFALISALTGMSDAPEAGERLRLVFTAPLEFFFTKLKLAAFGAVVIAFPVIAWQVYAFVAPGLYKRERRAFLPFLMAAPGLFLLWFSLSQQIVGSGAVSVELLPKVSDYLTLVTTLLLAFGLCFQLPVVLTLLALTGLVNAQMLRTGRRYAILGVFVVAAVVTPPDPISQLSLAIPIILLYEISIWCVVLMERRRRRDEAAAGGTDIIPTCASPAGLAPWPTRSRAWCDLMESDRRSRILHRRAFRPITGSHLSERALEKAAHLQTAGAPCTTSRLFATIPTSMRRPGARRAGPESSPNCWPWTSACARPRPSCRPLRAAATTSPSRSARPRAARTRPRPPA